MSIRRFREYECASLPANIVREDCSATQSLECEDSSRQRSNWSPSECAGVKQLEVLSSEAISLNIERVRDNKIAEMMGLGTTALSEF